jgi:acetyl esterase/lipase
MREPTLFTPVLLGLWTAILGGCTEVVVETDVSYDDRSRETVLDIYAPPPAAMPRPAVIAIHGGGWANPIKRDSIADQAERLAQAGYVTLNVEYRRVGTGGEFPGAVQDCFCALAWARAHAGELGIDPDRIAGIGYSAGGHLVSMLGTAMSEPAVAPDCAAGPASQFNAVISGAGPQDMTALAEASAAIAFMGGRKEDIPERYAQASPLTHVAAGAPPFLFIHGESDYFVDISHSQRMRAELDKVGGDTRLLEVPGGGHVWNDAAGTWEFPMTSLDTPAAQAALIDFLDEKIGPVR